jgi:hypothetical protein
VLDPLSGCDQRDVSDLVVAVGLDHLLTFGDQALHRLALLGWHGEVDRVDDLLNPDVLTSMLGVNGLRGSLPIDTLLWPGVFVAALLVFVNVAPDTWDVRFRLNMRSGLAVGMALAVAVLAISSPSPFLYYQF